jgi:hypothetical protein
MATAISSSLSMSPRQAAGGRRSRRYIEFSRGPGVQHIAVATDDIITTVSELKARGVEFLSVPDVYYDEVWNRVGVVERMPRWSRRNFNILVDCDDEGYLLQLSPSHTGPSSGVLRVNTGNPVPNLLAKATSRHCLNPSERAGAKGRCSKHLLFTNILTTKYSLQFLLLHREYTRSAQSR